MRKEALKLTVVSVVIVLLFIVFLLNTSYNGFSIKKDIFFAPEKVIREFFLGEAGSEPDSTIPSPSESTTSFSDIERVYIVVADNIYNRAELNVQSAVQQYKADIEAEGKYVVDIIEWNEYGDNLEYATTLRNFLRDSYLTNDLEGAIFVGNIPFVIFLEGDSSKSILGLYFRDLNGIWEDRDNDGEIDFLSAGKSPEIWTGRIKTDQITGSIDEEIIMINDYFEKNHAFRIKDPSNPINDIPKRGLVYSNDGFGLDGKTKLSNIYGEGGEILEVIKPDTTLDYFRNLLDPTGEGYESVVVGAHGGTAFADGRFAYQEIIDLDPKAIFYDITGCGAGSFQSNLKGTSLAATQYYIFSTSYGLAAITTSASAPGVGKEFYDYLYQGRSLGEGLVGAETVEFPEVFGFAILGDPTLSFPNEQWANENHPIPSRPTKPTGGPNILTNGYPKQLYQFTFGPAIEDNVKYFIKWDDGKTEITDSISSGNTITLERSFKDVGTYWIRYYIIDSDGTFSDWADPLEVVIGEPKMSIQKQSFDLIIEKGESISPLTVPILNEGNFPLELDIYDTMFGEAKVINSESGSSIVFSNKLIKDSYGNLHLFYAAGLGERALFHQKWNTYTKSWEEVEEITGDRISDISQSVESMSASIDSLGNFHVLWNQLGETPFGSLEITDFYYSKYSAKDKAWDSPIHIYSDYDPIIGGKGPLMGMISTSSDEDGTSHALYITNNWREGEGLFTHYLNLNDINFPKVIPNLKIVRRMYNLVEKDGFLHLLAIQAEDGYLTHFIIDPIEGVILSSQTVCGSVNDAWKDQILFKNSLGELQVICKGTDPVTNILSTKHLFFDESSSTWIFYPDSGVGFSKTIALEEEGDLHTIHPLGGERVYGRFDYSSKTWGPRINAVSTLFSGDGDLIKDDYGKLHLITFGRNTKEFTGFPEPYDWLESSELTKTINSGEVGNIIINLDTSNLPPGKYQKYLFMETNELGSNTYGAVPINLIVKSDIPSTSSKVKVRNFPNSIKVYWKKVTTNEDGFDTNDITGYSVYRKVVGEVNFLLIDQVDLFNIEYEDTTVLPGVNYVYAVGVLNSKGLESELTFSTGELVCGDVNWDGYVDIADLVQLLDFLFIFSSGSDVSPLWAGNVDGVDGVDISDLTTLIDHLFINFPQINCAEVDPSLQDSSDPTGGTTYEEAVSLIENALN